MRKYNLGNAALHTNSLHMYLHCTSVQLLFILPSRNSFGTQVTYTNLCAAGGTALENGGKIHVDKADCMCEVDFESESECGHESKADCESEAESDAVGQLVHMAVSSRSAPAPVSITPNSQAEADTMHRGQARPIPHHHSTIPMSGQAQGTAEVSLGQQRDTAEEGAVAAQVQPELGAAEQVRVARRSNGQYASGLSSLQAALSKGEGNFCSREAVQQAPAVATSERSKQSCLLAPFRMKMMKRTGSAESAAVRSGTAMPAAAGGVPAGAKNDSKVPKSHNGNPVQKLRKVLGRKLWPGCTRQADTHTTPLSPQQDKATKDQQAAATTELTVPDSSPAMPDESQIRAKHGPMQKVKGKAGRCLQKVMPACMKPPPVHSMPHKQADVQPLTAVAGSIRKQELTADEAGGQRQGLSKLTGLFKRKKAASKQALSGSPAGILPTPLVQEPSDFIPAVRQPHGLAVQADVSNAMSYRQAGVQPLTAVAGKQQPPADEAGRRFKRH